MICVANVILSLFVLALLDVSRSSPIIKSSADSELLSVVTVSRHGDRSPTKSFPNDLYLKKENWPMGYGQLTKNGIKRQYQLGQWLRQRYNTFLSSIYTRDEIYVYSTDEDRTLMSSEALLSGLYPPQDFQIWNNNINWQPIPVHTKERKKDDIFVDKRDCKKYKKAYKVIRSTVFHELKRKYNKTFEIISKNTGWNNVTPRNVATLFTDMYCYDNYQKSFIPDWYKSLSNQTLDEIEKIAVTTKSVRTNNINLARLEMGPFNNYLFNYFDNFTNQKIPETEATPKCLIMTAHDGNLISILNTFGAFNHRYTGYSDTIIFELRKNSNGTIYVNALYKKNDELEKLNLLDCEYNCKYDLLKRKAEKVTVTIEDYEKECEDYAGDLYNNDDDNNDYYDVDEGV